MFKGKFLSFIMRKVFVLLALSKNQMDTLNNLIKAILSFVSGEDETLCQHIHAGHQSCVRECERRVDKRDTFVEESFSSCELFSLALDTALFG